LEGGSYFQAVIRDITERKRAEEALKESENKYRTLFETSRDALLLVNAEEGMAVDCNRAALQMFGYANVEELTSEHVSERSPRLQPNGQVSKKLASELLIEVLTQGSSFAEWTYRRMDGTEFPTEVQLSKVELEGEMYFQVAIRDITERKQVEDALSESENKYRTLFEQSADAILIIEEDRFVDCNTATVKMLGYKNKKELLDSHPSELSPKFQPDGRRSFEKANEMLSIALNPVRLTFFPLGVVNCADIGSNKSSFFNFSQYISVR